MAKAKKLELSVCDRVYFESLIQCDTTHAQVIQRASIILLKADGHSIDYIADKLNLNRKSVLLCLKKYVEGGAENAIFNTPGRGRNPEISYDEKKWIIQIACKKPNELGYTTDKWSYTKLTFYVNKNAEATGFKRLSTISRSSIKNILDEAEIKPHKSHMK